MSTNGDACYCINLWSNVLYCMSDEYDPAKIKQHVGRVYTTQNGTNYTFKSKVSKVSKEFPTDEAVMLNITVEISSEIVVTSAA